MTPLNHFTLGLDMSSALLYIERMKRKSVGYRLSLDALKLLCSLARVLGLSKTSVIELAIRELAKRNDFV
jgi:hypothetical protein